MQFLFLALSLNKFNKYFEAIFDFFKYNFVNFSTNVVFFVSIHFYYAAHIFIGTKITSPIILYIGEH